jgi:hypothetical protein
MLVSTASRQYRLSGMPRIYSCWFGGVRFLGYPDDMSWFERSRSAIYQNTIWFATIWFAKASVVLRVPSPITSMVNFYGSPLDLVLFRLLELTTTPLQARPCEISLGDLVCCCGHVENKKSGDRFCGFAVCASPNTNISAWTIAFHLFLATWIDFIDLICVSQELCTMNMNV